MKRHPKETNEVVRATLRFMAAELEDMKDNLRKVKYCTAHAHI